MARTDEIYELAEERDSLRVFLLTEENPEDREDAELSLSIVVGMLENLGATEDVIQAVRIDVMLSSGWTPDMANYWRYKNA